MTTYGDRLYQLGGIPVGIGNGLVPSTTGNVFFVDSGATGTAIGDSPANACLTTDAAVGKCTASNGDIIIVREGHAETISTASSLVIDVAGVTVICLGHGESQAVFSYSAAASTITVSAANCRFVGGVHQATYLDVASAFTLSTAKSFTLEGARFEDTGSSLNFLSIVTTNATANAADDLTVTSNKWYGLNTTPLAFVSILANQNRPTLTFNRVDLASTADVGSFLTLSNKNVLGAFIAYNVHNPIGASGNTVGIFITGSGTSTGFVVGNQVCSLDTTTPLLSTTSTGFRFNDNILGGAAGADLSGIVTPAIT